MKVFVSAGLVGVGERPLWLPGEAGSGGAGESGEAGLLPGPVERPSCCSWWWWDREKHPARRQTLEVE